MPLEILSNTTIRLERVIEAMRARKYRVYDKDYQLNIVGIRRWPLKVDVFNDTLFVFHALDGQWIYQKYQITTIPGLTYLEEKFFNKAGTAIVVPGQYRDHYEVDLHWGYQALCQKRGRAIPVYRDNMLDGIPELNEAKRGTGLGINIHRAARDGCSVRVSDYSAGCQVFRCAEHFDGFMSTVRRARDEHGNSFTYALLNEQDVS